MDKPKVILRADGGEKIGMGHFIRTLALGEMLKDEYLCVYATKSPSAYQGEEINKVCHDTIELPGDENHYQVFLELLSGDEIVVLDNYYFDTNYQKKIKDKGCKLVCIDDVHDKYYLADLVINHAPLDPGLFSCAPYTRLRLGFDYALLRKQFLTGNHRKKDSEFKRVLLAFGGADINNLTYRILSDLLIIDIIETIDIVVGNAFKNLAELNKKVANSSGTKLITVYKDLDSATLVEIIRRIDFAIVPASTILLEILSQDVPVITGYYVDNQVDIARTLQDKYPGVLVVNDFNEASIDKNRIESLRTMMIAREDQGKKRIIDGESPKRILKEFNVLSKEFHIQTRKALKDDLKLFFNWANDKTVRDFSISKAEISIEDHSAWFYKKIQSIDSVMYVFEESKNALGQVRFDRKDELIQIGYSIDKYYRGKGFGKVILKLALENILNEPLIENCSSIIGKVRVTNEASTRVFKDLNFDQADIEIHNGDRYYVFKKDIQRNDRT